MNAAEHRVRIRAEVSAADPNSCRFVCSEVVHPGGPYLFASIAEAAGSPLAEQLFDLGTVTQVLITESIVTVTKSSDASWAAQRASIGAAIRACCEAGVPAVLEGVPDVDGRSANGQRNPAMLREVLETLFEREVNPKVASHGGHIDIVDVTESVLTISMSGGCQGCASSQVTIKAGVEVMVRRVAPEIIEIVDLTDHAAGRDPYHRSPMRSVPVSPRRG